MKDWDISINYGIKTGYNDAFIISGAKRAEILAGCKTEEERKRTDELIRPVLRGRDIRRYGYEFADLYLIATFPSRHYNIEEYPAVKKHLLSFGIERLEQSGKEYIVNGEKIKARKKTNNKWFETQDSISYWDDFFKPKIVYPETTQGAYFAYDDKGMFIDKTCFMMISKDALFLQKILSSKLFEVAYKKIFSSIELGESGYQYNKHALIKLPVKKVEESKQKDFENLNKTEIDRKIYELYGLNNEEIDFINSSITTK